MKEIILTSVNLYQGCIDMPEGFEINREQLSTEILFSSIFNKKLEFSKNIDKINTYLREFIYLKYKFTLVNMDTWGSVLLPSDHLDNIIEVNLMDLKNSPDYIMIYGVNINSNSFKINIEYDNNRRKKNNKEITLNNNEFVMFPSILKYSILENTSNKPNIFLTTTYEYI